MSDEFRAGLDAVANSDPDALQVVLSEAEEHFFHAELLELGTSAAYVGAAPPVDLLRGHELTARDVANAIDQTDLGWRLDVIMALDDYLT